MEELRDIRDRVIKVGSRVHVVPRPSSLIPGYELPGFSGAVIRLSEDFWGLVTVHITEFGTHHYRAARPEYCRVQYGKHDETQALTTKGEERDDVNGSHPATAVTRKF